MLRWQFWIPCILIKWICFSLIYRCVLNWFGDWSNGALYQVGREFTNKIDLEKGNYVAPQNIPVMYDLPVTPSHREVVINAFVFVHLSLHQANSRVLKRGGRITSVTPRHYLDFINHFVSLYTFCRFTWTLCSLYAAFHQFTLYHFQIHIN